MMTTITTTPPTAPPITAPDDPPLSLAWDLAWFKKHTAVTENYIHVKLTMITNTFIFLSVALFKQGSGQYWHLSQNSKLNGGMIVYFGVLICVLPLCLVISFKLLFYFHFHISTLHSYMSQHHLKHLHYYNDIQILEPVIVNSSPVLFSHPQEAALIT